MKTTDYKRFFSLSKRNENGCWEWIGSGLPKGYGIFWLSGKRMYAHRASMCLFRQFDCTNPLFVLHSCDNPKCVNPNHLFLGTQTDNIRDCSRKGRHKRIGDWRGTRNPKSKISDADLYRISVKLLNGFKDALVAEKFSITNVRVGQIRRALGIGLFCKWPRHVKGRWEQR